jgi:hypothetical protein
LISEKTKHFRSCKQKTLRDQVRNIDLIYGDMCCARQKYKLQKNLNQIVTMGSHMTSFSPHTSYDHMTNPELRQESLCENDPLSKPTIFYL